MITSYVLLYYIIYWNKVCNQIRTETLTLIHIGRAREVFHDNVIFFTWNLTYVTR